MSESAQPALELQVLGPVRLLRAGQPLPLNTRKTLALLALLVLQGPQNRQRLCAWLWPELDESSARRNLRRELVRLREAGATGAVLAEGEALRAAAELSCDLLRAQTLLRSGQADAALLLWRGETFAGLHAEAHGDDGLAPWLATQRLQAQALRADLLQASAAAAESRGDLAAALAHVHTLLHADNLQERHHREAMRLLAATGQREAALRQFETCRALLASELGLQPMPQTLALGELLRGGPPPEPTPTPAAPAATGAVQLPPQLPFVGREAEVARLQQAWARRQPVVLVGEAGVGKTRLATDFAAAQGPYAWVRCHSGDAELPLSAFARALRALAGQPAELGELEPWVVAELARVLPELGTAPPPLRSANDRLRFDEACVRAWCALADGAFDAVVLDDWQLADPASRALLARVVARRREHGPGGAIELLAWRGEADDAELLATAQALGAETLPLARLPDAAVHELVRRLSGVAEPVRFTQRLHTATGGHPFFMAETLRDLAERALLHRDAQGRWHTPFDEQTESYQELPLPASVRDAVLSRVRRLGAPATRLLEAAALAGEPLRAAWLAQACALSEHEALAALEQAAQAYLVMAREGGGYGWAHDLARQTLDQSLQPTRRRLVHHRLALAAEAMGVGLEAARHFEACGEPARAVQHRLAAGDAAHGLRGLDEAAAQWRQGLADTPALTDEAALLARLCDNEWQRGHHDQALALFERLQGLLADPALAEHARMDLNLRAARFLARSGRPQDALALLETPPSPESASLRLRWGILRMDALSSCGHNEQARAEGLLTLAAAPAATRERAEALSSLSLVARTGGQLQEAWAHADASLALYTRMGDALAQAHSLVLRGGCSLELGDVSAAEADLRTSATLAQHHGSVHVQRMALYNLAALYGNQTLTEQALAVAHEAWPTLAGLPGEEMSVIFRCVFIECYHISGTWGLLWGHLEAAVDQVLGTQLPLSTMSVANAVLEPAAALGQWPRVLPLVRALDEQLSEEVSGFAESALACAQAALIMGQPQAAAAWFARMPTNDVQENPRMRCRAQVLHAELQLALGAGPQVLDELPADDAPGMNQELRLRALTVRCRAGNDSQARALALAALDDPGAHAAAALALARTLGGTVYTERRQRLADSLAALPEVQRSFLATWS